jgi:hypothetical protein
MCLYLLAEYSILGGGVATGGVDGGLKGMVAEGGKVEIKVPRAYYAVATSRVSRDMVSG